MSIDQEEPTPEEMGIEQKPKFFGSVKAGEINQLAREMLWSQDPKEHLTGAMLNNLVDISLENATAGRVEAEQTLDSTVNYDGMTGEKLDPELKAASLQKAMEYFDELQEMRDALIANGAKKLG